LRGRIYIAVVAALCLLGSPACAHCAGEGRGAPIDVIIDTDPAISVPTGLDVDDDLAILFALASPELHVLGLTATYGNASIADTYADALDLMRLAGFTRIPVVRGAGWTTRDVHRATDASRFLIGTIMRNEGRVTVITLGPLTNLASALTQEPRIEQRIERIVIMGGTLHSRLPDLNIMAHPEASEIVFGTAIPKVMVPLDTCIQTAFKRGQLEMVKRHPESVVYGFRHRLGLWVRLWRPLGRLAFDGWPRLETGGFYPWDVVATAYLVTPELFSDERCYIVHMDGVWLSAEPCDDLSDHRFRVLVPMRLDSRAFVELMMRRVCSVGCSSPVAQKRRSEPQQ